jgi:hypothetical protein
VQGDCLVQYKRIYDHEIWVERLRKIRKNSSYKMRSGIMRLTGHAAHNGAEGMHTGFGWGNLKKIATWKTWDKWEDNIKIDL